MIRRYVYRPNEKGEIQAYEVGAEWTDAPRSTGDLGKFEYDNLRATDGTDISSRSKHKTYMKEKGLSLFSDFTDTWAKAKAEREAFHSGNSDRAARREAVERAFHQSVNRRKR